MPYGGTRGQRRQQKLDDVRRVYADLGGGNVFARTVYERLRQEGIEWALQYTKEESGIEGVRHLLDEVKRGLYLLDEVKRELSIPETADSGRPVMPVRKLSPADEVDGTLDGLGDELTLDDLAEITVRLGHRMRKMVRKANERVAALSRLTQPWVSPSVMATNGET